MSETPPTSTLDWKRYKNINQGSYGRSDYCWGVKITYDNIDVAVSIWRSHFRNAVNRTPLRVGVYFVYGWCSDSYGWNHDMAGWELVDTTPKTKVENIELGPGEYITTYEYLVKGQQFYLYHIGPSSKKTKGASEVFLKDSLIIALPAPETIDVKLKVDDLESICALLSALTWGDPEAIRLRALIRGILNER